MKPTSKRSSAKRSLLAPEPLRRSRVARQAQPDAPTRTPAPCRRRVTLLHYAGVPWREIGERVGQTDIATTANTYSLVLTDTTELDHETLLRV